MSGGKINNDSLRCFYWKLKLSEMPPCGGTIKLEDNGDNHAYRILSILHSR